MYAVLSIIIPIRSGSTSRPELNGIQVGVVHGEADAHRPPGQRPQITLPLPRDNALDFVSVQLNALREPVSVKRPAIRILELDAHTARGRRRVVQDQLIARKGERPGYKLTAGIWRVNRDKTVRPK